jgi:hypothetical protein
MFRIEVFVDDKKLVQFLNATVGLVASMSPPQPVVNLAKPHKDLNAASNGNIADMYHAELDKKGKTEFTVQDVKKWLEKVGRSPLSNNYLLKTLKNQKLIKMVSPGNYQVMK